MQQKTLSAGVVVIHIRPDSCRYLLLRCFRNWDFPKGIVEAGETAFSAAKREVREETTLDELDFRWGEVSFETTPYGRGKVARYYPAVADTDAVTLPVDATLGRPEHHEFRWVKYQDARSLLPQRLLGVIDWAHALTGC